MRQDREDAEIALCEEPRAKAFSETENIGVLLEDAYDTSGFDIDGMHEIHMRLRSVASDLRVLLAGGGK